VTAAKECCNSTKDDLTIVVRNMARAVAYTLRGLDRSPRRHAPAHLSVGFAPQVLHSLISLQQCTTRGCHPFWLSSGHTLDESSPNGLRQLIDEAHRQQDHHQEKAYLVPVIDADAVGQLQANATSPHDS
jgi:hypothetical protein